MLPESVWPDDVALLEWHPDPGSRRYSGRKTAGRAAAWLNTHTGKHDCWCYRPTYLMGVGWVLERRWVGRWDGALGL